MKRQSWLLMSPEEISLIIVSNNTLFRKQKSYFNRTGNVVMIARIQAAIDLHKNCVEVSGNPHEHSV